MNRCALQTPYVAGQYFYQLSSRAIAGEQQHSDRSRSAQSLPALLKASLYPLAMTDPLFLESLSPEAQQFLLQYQADRQLPAWAQAAQQVLEASCITTERTQAPLSLEHQALLTTTLITLTQCQSQLANAVVTLNALTAAVLHPTGGLYDPAVAAWSTGGMTHGQAPSASLSWAHTARRGLTGTALAARLQTSASMISRKRSQVGFGRWSQARDPDGLTWLYTTRTRRFHPVESVVPEGALASAHEQTVELTRLANPNLPQAP
ncbi:MAG: hypothetical protein ACAF41_34610 (plasmid) [Leptolyngbya sp. BL-A-14]